MSSLDSACAYSHLDNASIVHILNLRKLKDQPMFHKTQHNGNFNYNYNIVWQ